MFQYPYSFLVHKILFEYAKNFNFFPSIPPSTDEHELRNQRISTRLFLVLLSTSLIILLIYNSLITVTITKTIQTPSLKQYEELYETYSKTLTCPCQKMSIDYKNIVQINFTLHQVCDSDFISEKWIKYLAHSFDQNSIIFNDFRSFSLSLFQTLNLLCEQTNKIIVDNLKQSDLSQYISTIVTSLDLFQSQIETFAKQLKSTITYNFLFMLDLIRTTTTADGLHSALNTNYRLYKVSTDLAVRSQAYNYSNCLCSLSSTCFIQSSIPYSHKAPPVIVPGIYQGCYVIDGLFRSTLECFYDQSCIDKVQFYAVSIITFRAQAMYPKSRFLINSTMGEIIQELMIEEWNWTPKYENYYNECRPIECKYSYETKSGLVYIVTATIGLIGGLFTALKIAVPFCVNVIIRKRRSETERTGFRICEQVSILFRKIKIFLTTFNFFPSIPPSTDEHELRNQRISTRLFLVLLSTSLIILLIYNSLITVTITKTIQTPSLKKYEELYETYSKTLTCPCQKMSIDYKDIVQINFTLHQMCKNDTIAEAWYLYLSYGHYAGGISSIDFREVGKHIFHALRFCCELANNMIETSLSDFEFNQYISPVVTSSDLFKSQIETSGKQFKSTTTYNFLVLLSLIRITNTANGLYSVTTQNYQIYLSSDGKTYLSRPSRFGDCECNRSSVCFSPSTIYTYPQMKPIFSVPGVYHGCYIVDALFRSTLECFYDKECVDKVQSYVESSVSFRPRVLDASLKSRFLINSTMGEIIQESMIEEWNWTPRYENYYNECQPIECTYSYETKIGVVYIVTATIGLIGGLFTALKIAVPNLVKFIDYLIRRCAIRKMNPQISIESILR
ncbi:unnamed protein product [Adineta ricciae]|uniref:Uncharacterized protein n=1 Tax=Adineta ricciae TaxID=249248 RepID=A0A814SFB3_ADIRI|nr:unnamed protein product [Adineta ricciae]